MSDKKLSKAKLDELLILCNEYYHGDVVADKDALDKMVEAGKALERDAGIGMFSLLDFVTGMIRSGGLKPDATIEDICKVLEVLDWQVVDDEQTEH